MADSHSSPRDAVTQNLLMRLVPERWRGLAQLARLDRPIGTWLLFWPCLWGLVLASAQGGSYPSWDFVLLFALGAFVLRGAGCTFNDIVDRNLDAQVARTAARPLPAGRVSIRAALGFLMAQLLVGLAVLLAFNPFTIMLGVVSLLLVAVYPFMKRFTWWPQLFLGLAFNWGALMGYAALAGQISPAALFLYAAGICWTLGYDTIYAHQDRQDDALIGIKSTALLLGRNTKPALIVFYTASLLCLAVAGSLGGMQMLFWVGLTVAAWHMMMQVAQLNIDDANNCLLLFRANRDTGLIIAASFMLGIF